MKKTKIGNRLRQQYWSYKSSRLFIFTTMLLTIASCNLAIDPITGNILKQMKQQILGNTIQEFQRIPSLSDGPCKPPVDRCVLCDKDNACTRCKDGLFLDIEEKPFKCVECPDVCGGCDQTGCKSCQPGYFKKQIQFYDRQSFVCSKCSKTCRTCSNYAEFCETCPDYYILEAGTNKCKFKYSNIIALAIVFGILILVLGTYACCQFVCKEKKPVVRVTRYGSILDKDPELRKDHLKYDAKTIGLNDQSMISEVKPEDNSYMNASGMDKTLTNALTNMLPQDLTTRQDVDSNLNDIQFDVSWDKSSMPDFNSNSDYVPVREIDIDFNDPGRNGQRRPRHKTFKR